MKLFKIFLSSFIFLVCVARSDNKLHAAILNAAIGDALGRVTEFVDTKPKIYDKFGPKGVQHLSQAMINHPITHMSVVPYTDDTVMSLIVFNTVAKGRHENHSLEQMLDTLAHQFADLFGKNKYIIDPLYDLRAHGLRNIKAGNELNILINHGEDQNSHWFYNRPEKDIITEAGCGSVMRAWPIGLIFADNLPMVIMLADAQSKITHRHPMARAACAAMAVGTACAYNNKSVDETVAAMIATAELFDSQELLYKKNAQKFFKTTALTADMIAEDQLLTSDMIRYAYDAARAQKVPNEILGINNKKLSNARSPKGYLLGWAADEAIAAAVYLFVRNADNPQHAIIEGVNTPGDSDSIASLAGALVGARTGIVFHDPDCFLLENKEQLDALGWSLQK